MPYYQLNSTFQDVINDPLFQNFGHLFFPVHRRVSSKMTLQEVTSSNVYIWYSNLHSSTTVNILNTFHKAAKEYPIFYSIEEMELNPSKRFTGLFFLKSKKNAPICDL